MSRDWMAIERAREGGNQADIEEVLEQEESDKKESLHPALMLGQVVTTRRKLLELLTTMADHPQSVDPEVVRRIVRQANSEVVLEVGKPRDWKWLEINAKEIPAEADSSTGHTWATLTLRGKGLE
jgi:hypothetical protein